MLRIQPKQADGVKAQSLQVVTQANLSDVSLR